MSQINLLPFNTIKFREISADSALFYLPGHTPELPQTLTFTRVLPTPRKGNLGTHKVMINVRNTVNIGTGDVKKYVPIVTKLETSVPIGSHVDELVNVGFVTLQNFISSSLSNRQELNNLFVIGMMPDTEVVDPNSDSV